MTKKLFRKIIVNKEIIIMEIKINYFLIGKATHCADTFVTAEEREEHGPFYQKRMTEGYFLYCISDLLYGEESAEGVAVECLLFDENVGKFEDLELGKYYMLVTDGNVVLFIKEIQKKIVCMKTMCRWMLNIQKWIKLS